MEGAEDKLLSTDTNESSNLSTNNGIRSSVRIKDKIRNKSGKNFRDPNFIYSEFLSHNKPPTGNLDRARSASCSNISPETSKKHKKNNKKDGLNLKINGRKGVNASVGNTLYSTNSENDLSDRAIAFKNKQRSLSQQRIDVLFNNPPSEVSSSNSSLFRTETESDLSEAQTHFRINTNKEVTTSQSSIVSIVSAAESFISTSEYLTESETGASNISEDRRDTSTTHNYTMSQKQEIVAQTGNSSGLDIINPQPGSDPHSQITTGEVPHDWKSFLLQIKQDLQTSIETSAATLRTDFQRGINEIKNEQTKLKSDLEATTGKCNKNETELRAVRTELVTYKHKLDTITGVSIKQSQELNECKTKLEKMQRQMNRDILRLIGIEERDEENVYETVAKFFKDKLKVDKEIALADAYRVGKGKFRTIVIQLKNYRSRGLIFSHVKNLKELTNSDDKPFQIREHLSPKELAERQRNQKILRRNKKLSAANQLVINVEKMKLKIDGQMYEKGVATPSCENILEPTTQCLGNQLGIKVVPGDSVTMEGQSFCGFTASVRSLEEVNSAYIKVRTMNSKARHVVAAWVIPGRSFATLADSQDDDEHGMGETILNQMELSDVTNRAVFVARYYDGTHIGPKRYDAFMNAARNALLAQPLNEIHSGHEYLLAPEEIVEKHLSRLPTTRPQGGRGRSKQRHEKRERHDNTSIQVPAGTASE